MKKWVQRYIKKGDEYFKTVKEKIEYIETNDTSSWTDEDIAEFQLAKDILKRMEEAKYSKLSEFKADQKELVRIKNKYKN